MRAGRLALAAALLLAGCDTRAGVASSGSQDLPSPVSYRVTGTVTVGKGPKGVAVDPGTHTVYVANRDDDTVSVIDAATRTEVASIPVDEGPFAVAVDPGTHTVYVTHPFGHRVSVIDGRTRVVITTVPVIIADVKHPGGALLGDVAVDPGTHMVYVTDSTYGRLVVVDGISHRIVDTLNVGGVQTGVAVDPETHTVYVSRERVAGNGQGSGAFMLSVIDGPSRTVITDIPGGLGWRAVAVDSPTRSVYVANLWERTVSVIDTATRAVTATIPVDRYHGENIAVDPGTHAVYVRIDNAVAVIDGSTRTVAATLPLGSDKYDVGSVAVDPDSHIAYVTSARTVSIIEGVIG